MIEKLLEELNFTQGESKVYVFLITVKEINAKQISMQTGLSLSKTYEILERLILKGLVTQLSRNNVKYYCSLPLEALNSILENEQENILKKQKELKKLISKNKKNNTVSKSTQIRIFSGYNGIKTFYKELENIYKNEEYYGFMIDSEIVKNKIILRLIDNFHKLRSQDSKKSKILIEENTNYNTIKLKKNPYPYYEFRATKSLFPKNLSIIGDKVIHFNINVKEDKYEVIETTSNTLASTYRELFLKLWNE